MVVTANLADHPDAISEVARWMAQWDDAPGDSVDEWVRWIRGRLNRDAVPITLIALSDGRPVGTAALVEHDMSTRQDLSPWLAAVYVLRAFRRKGVGSALVNAAMEKARRLGICALYLYTPDMERFYAGLGWSTIETTRYAGRRVTVMKYEPPS